MSKLNFFLVILITHWFHGQSQNIDGICSEADWFGNPVDNNQIIYHKYDPVLQLKKRYASFDEVENQTPEELLISQMSAKNNEWLAYNFENEVKWNDEQFQRISSQDPQKNFIELIRKITYKIGGVDYSILRLKIYDDRKKKPATLSLMAIKKQEKWVFVQNKDKSPLEFLMTNLNLNNLDEIFENKNSDNSLLNEIIESSWNSNYLSPSSIYRRFGDNMLVNDGTLDNVFERNNPSIQENSFQEYNNVYTFKESTINVNYVVPLSNQTFCYYFLNRLSKFESTHLNVLILYLENKNLDEEGNKPKILPIHEFRFAKDNREYVFIKYSLNRSDNSKKIITNVLEYESNIYGELNQINTINNNLKYIIGVAKSDFILQISNGENDANYPDINILKPKVKDANGVLNIQNLVQIIRNNSASLTKYLDN